MVGFGEKLKDTIETIVGGLFEDPNDDGDGFKTIADEIGQEEAAVYGVNGNVAMDPKFYEREEKSNMSKVRNFPNATRGFEIVTMEPRKFEDSSSVVQYLKDRKTVIMNLHLLDREQSQRTIDFVSGAVHALNGNLQKVGESVFMFTPSNIVLSNLTSTQEKFNDSLWRATI